MTCPDACDKPVGCVCQGETVFYRGACIDKSECPGTYTITDSVKYNNEWMERKKENCMFHFFQNNSVITYKILK